MERQGLDHPAFPGLPVQDAAGHGKSVVRARVGLDALDPVGAGPAPEVALAGSAEYGLIIRDSAARQVVRLVALPSTDGDRRVAVDRRDVVGPGAAALADEVRKAAADG